MDKRLVLLAGVAAVALGLVLVPAASGARTIGVRETAQYEWHAGDDFLAAVNPAFSPVVAMAGNGDTVEIKAMGTLSLMPRMATGGGTFVHKAPDGTVRASGDITVLGLIMFRSYGSSPDLPPTFEGGLALLRVHVQPAAGGSGFSAILVVDCEIGNAPPGHGEGVRLVVEDVINFNKMAGGATLFINTS